MSTIAASASKAFLLPPPADFVLLSTAPPNVNEGAEETASEVEELSTSALALPVDASTSGSSVEGFSGEAMLATSRAGAAALAAPAEDTGDAPFMDSGLSFLADGTFGFASEAAIEAILGDFVCWGTAPTDSFDSPDGAITLEALAAKLGSGVAFCALVAGTGLTIDAARGTAGLGTRVGFADAGAEFAGLGVAIVADGLAPSFLRNRPRATRSVPLACSTLMGLVRTRF